MSMKLYENRYGNYMKIIWELYGNWYEMSMR